MGAKSDIEWTDATWTPLRAFRDVMVKGELVRKMGWHCEHASEGCRFCYSEGFNLRLGTGLEFKPSHRADIEIFLDEKMLTAPLRWKKPRKIFVCSMTDLFADFVKDEWIDRVFAVMALCPQHIFIVLTKRSERAKGYLLAFQEGKRNVIANARDIAGGNEVRQHEAGDAILDRWTTNKGKLPNVWLGVSVEDQENANKRIPDLLHTPAARRFLSCEPLLGPIDLRAIRWEDEDAEIRMDVTNGEAWVENTDSAAAYTNEADGNPNLDWVICGGESGPNARPMHPDWARSLRDQCEGRVPFFFKQHGAWEVCAEEEPNAELIGVDPEIGEHDCAFDRGSAEWMRKVGKDKAGRLLDGREHNEFPEAR